MRLFRSVLVIALLVAGILPLLKQPPASAETPTLYVALGDSIAYGIGSSLPRKRGYPAFVARYIEEWSGTPVEAHNLAVPGETSSTFMTEGQLDRFREIMDSRPSGQVVISVSLGGNELLDARNLDRNGRQAALDAFTADFTAALGQIRSLAGDDAVIAVTNVYDLSEGNPDQEFSDAWWVGRFNAVIEETARANGASLADIAGEFRGQISRLTHDPWDVHPKNRGFLAIARQVWSAIGFDQIPPEIEVVSGLESVRSLRTLQLRVIDDGMVESVSVDIAGREPVTPARRSGDVWVLLVDADIDSGTSLPVVVRAMDRAGNEHSARFELTVTAN